MLPDTFSHIISLPIALLVLAGLSILVLLWRHFNKPALLLAPGVPVMGKPDDASFEEAVRDGDRLVSECPRYQIVRAC